MSDLDRNWTITLPFSVPAGNDDGTFTEALLEAALEHGPSAATGMVARADTAQGEVWIVFTLVDSSRQFAEDVASSMRHRVADAVLSGEDACITPSYY